MYSTDLSPPSSPCPVRHTTTDAPQGSRPTGGDTAPQFPLARTGQTQLERLRALLCLREQPRDMACSDFRPSRPAAIQRVASLLPPGGPTIVSERGRGVAALKQRLLTAGMEVQGRVKELLSGSGYLGRHADDVVWQAYLAELGHEVDKVLAHSRPVSPEAPLEQNSATFAVTPLQLPGKGGLSLLRLHLPDGQTLDAFSADLQDPGAYHERQLGSECTLSTINMLNAYLSGSFAGLRTSAQLQQWMQERNRPSQSGGFDTRQACGFNNCESREVGEVGEGRWRLHVATLGVQSTGEIVSVMGEDFQEFTADAFDRSDAVGIVMRMPIPNHCADAVRKESHHTAMLCRRSDGGFQVRDSRHADCLSLEAGSMSAAIGQYRRQLGMADDSEENNVLEVIYPVRGPARRESAPGSTVSPRVPPGVVPPPAAVP